MSDPLPTLLNEHTWTTIKDTPGKHHRLIPIGGGELLDWTVETGHYDVWVPKSTLPPTGDPYRPAARTTGAFSTIRTGHALVHLADTPSNWSEGNVLDWVPATLGVRIWRYHRGITSGDPIPTLVNQSSFFSISSGHTLVYLDHDRVLDWEPASGRARVWNYDRARTTADPLPTKVTENVFATIQTGHQLLYLGGDLLLGWNELTGKVRVWRYDRSLTGNVDPFPTLEMEDSWAGEIAAGRRVHYLGGDQVLDWDPATGHERIWDFDRPMMPAASFAAMLNVDIATAVGWVGAAEAALVSYHAGLASSVHDAQWQATDFALTTHFHVNSLSADVQVALSKILDTYTQILTRLTTGTGSITQVSKAQALADLGGHEHYTRGYTSAASFTRLTPAYRPLDTIGDLGLDGAGPKLRAAILIHETAHFVGHLTDFAEEWSPAYSTLTTDQAVQNPSSYAAFAHNVATGVDLRFGNVPWL